jgi:hypothetical protein
MAYTAADTQIFWILTVIAPRRMCGVNEKQLGIYNSKTARKTSTHPVTMQSFQDQY